MKRELCLMFCTNDIFADGIMSMNRKKPDVDVIKDVLKAALAAYPASGFIQSLSFQYEERGGLSKKQLQGLYDKASKIAEIPAAKLATLEAVILKKPTRYKSPPPPPQPLYTKNEAAGQLINEILTRYPQHKRVLFFKTKYDNNEVLSSADIAELEKFYKVLK
jgi:hypothetical protein